jgi:hypothetical protein
VRALTIARAIIGAKIANGLTVLARYREKNEMSEVTGSTRRPC